MSLMYGSLTPSRAATLLLLCLLQASVEALAKGTVCEHQEGLVGFVSCLKQSKALLSI